MTTNPQPNLINPLPPAINPQPIVNMGDNPTGASIISYNVPEPTTYFGNMYFEIPLVRLLFESSDAALPGGLRAADVFKGPLPPFDGRQEAIQSLNESRGKIAALVETILNYGCSYKDSSQTDPVLRKVANFIYLPPQFGGLLKIWRDIRDELYHSTSTALHQPESPNLGNVLSLSASVPAYPVLDYRQSLIFRRFQKLLSVGLSEISSEIEAKLLDGNFFVVFRTFSGQYDYKYIPIPNDIGPKLFIIEKYKLSSFLGNYGAGRTLKTFSLLPGEKMKISVKTFKKSTIETKTSSSILDSYSQESADDFEDTLNRERSNKGESEEKSTWHAEAEAEGSFLGFGGSAGGGKSGESSSQRENIAKSVSDSVTKHSQKASSQREISIDTSYERKEETGEETSIEREIENINVGRTLNFVFRQMNQEYLTLLHLVDATVGYTSGLPGSFNQSAISNLDNFLSNILVDQFSIDVAKRAIVDHLIQIVNYDGESKPFIEPQHVKAVDPLNTERVLEWNYIRVPKKLTDTFENTSGLKKEVNGVIVSAQVNVMRTEGVFVEALLGQGNALDQYSHGLQEETVREKQVANDLKVREAEKIALANSIIANNEVEKAKLFAQMYPCCSEAVCNCNDSKLGRNDNDESSDA